MKLRQNFFNDKIFEVIPNIAKLTRAEKITDDLLIRLFELEEEELVGYKQYLFGGEGRIREEDKNYLLNLSKKDFQEMTRKNQKSSKSSQLSRKNEKII
jgi:hypothetical protein